MWGTFWRTLGRRISLIFMVADLLLPAYIYAIIRNAKRIISHSRDRKDALRPTPFNMFENSADFFYL